MGGGWWEGGSPGGETVERQLALDTVIRVVVGCQVSMQNELQAKLHSIIWQF